MENSCGCCRIGSLRVGYAAATDAGQVRRCNEDSYLLCPEAGMFAVADGLGGLGDGDQASRMAMTQLHALALSAPWWQRMSGWLPWGTG